MAASFSMFFQFHDVELQFDSVLWSHITISIALGIIKSVSAMKSKMAAISKSNRSL